MSPCFSIDTPPVPIGASGAWPPAFLPPAPGTIGTRAVGSGKSDATVLPSCSLHRVNPVRRQTGELFCPLMLNPLCRFPFVENRTASWLMPPDHAYHFLP